MSNQLTYRPDIDGLRSIAVFLVILHHAGFKSISGGFIGVDVFFVLSGFLITAIIYPKIQAQNFSLLDFFSRRVKRLMPVLFFVISCTTIAAFFILLPSDFLKFGKSIVWVVFSLGNFFFWREHGGYFEANSQEAPLLHTWSLAVEEQYYFVWPIMLIFMFKLFGSRNTIWLTIIITLIFTWLSELGTQMTIGAAYYLLPTRFYELLAGSALALLIPLLPSISKNIKHLLSILGLSLIIFSALYLTKSESFPGYNALYPVLGTLLLIVSNNSIINRLLALRPFVYTGKISYSLYLWHWPIFAFLRYATIELTLFVQIISIILTCLLSILSYHFIEQPIRVRSFHSRKKLYTYLYILPCIGFVGITYSIVSQVGVHSRFSSQINIQDQALNSSKRNNPCISSYHEAKDSPKLNCQFGMIKDNSPKVLIYGDSHANHLTPFFTKLVDDAEISLQEYTLNRCLPISSINWGSNMYKANLCAERNKLALNHIKQSSFDYVVLAASWPEIETKRLINNEGTDLTNINKLSLLQEGLEETVSAIRKTGAKVIIVKDLPTLGGKSPKCTLQNEVFNNNLSCSISHNKNKLISKLISDVESKFDDVYSIDIQKLYCFEGACSMSLGNMPLYRDDDHLNKAGAEALAKKYLSTSVNLFVKTN